MNSENLYKESQKYLPGGVSSPVRKFEPYPFFVKEAKGSKLIDVDGNDYIDYCLAYGPLILGHSNEQIVKSIKEQLELGTAYGAPTENEIKLAKEVISRVPCAEMIRFVNSGTEATMSAIRLARGFTNRDKIVKFTGSYHGAHDSVLVKEGESFNCIPDSDGIPQKAVDNTLIVPFNDEDALLKLIEIEGSNIAAIIVEPVMGNIGCVEPKEGFLEFLRKITLENDILLIFDEVITGFRIAKGGAQEYYSVVPDIVTFGKILGGGFPIGAFASSIEIMKYIAPSGNVYQAGTFNGNPISIKAGIETLNILNSSFYKTMEKKGNTIRNGLKDLVEDNSYELKVVGLSSMFQVYFNENEVINYEIAKKSNLDSFKTYFNTLLNEGIFQAPSQFEAGFISSAHNQEDLDKTLLAMDIALKKSFNKK